MFKLDSSESNWCSSSTLLPSLTKVSRSPAAAMAWIFVWWYYANHNWIYSLCKKMKSVTAFYWFQHHDEIPIIYKSNLKKIAEGIAMRGFLRCRPSFARSPRPPPLAYDCITLHPTKRFLALLKPNGFWAFTLSLLCKLQLHAQNK